MQRSLRLQTTHIAFAQIVSTQIVLAIQDGWGRWQLGFHALFTIAANCPNLKELIISEEHLEVGIAP